MSCSFRIRISIEAGLLEKINAKYIPTNRCADQEMTETKALGPYAAQGIFYVLIAALILCAIVLFIEVVHYKMKHRKVKPLIDSAHTCINERVQKIHRQQKLRAIRICDLPKIDG